MKRLPGHVEGALVRGDPRRLGSPALPLRELLHTLSLRAARLRRIRGLLGLCAEADLPGHPRLCPACLRLAREHSAPALLPGDLVDAERLAWMAPEDLRALGRLPFPMLREAGDRGFVRVSWEEALRRVGEVLRAVPPGAQRWAGDGRAAYALDRAALLLSGRVADQPRPVGGTGTLADLDSDLVLVWGSRLREAHPAVWRRLRQAKRGGARVVCVDLLDRLDLADDLVRLRPGGDASFVAAVLGTLQGWGALDEDYLAAFTTGLPELPGVEEATAASGANRELVEWLATLLARSSTTTSLVGRGADLGAVRTLHLALGRLGVPGSALLPLQPPGLRWDARARQRFERLVGRPAEGALVEARFAYGLGVPVRAPLRVHQLVHLDPSVAAPGELVVLLPMLRSSEEDGVHVGLDRRPVLRAARQAPSPGVEARPGAGIPGEVVRAALPGLPRLTASERERVQGRARWRPVLHEHGAFSGPGGRAVAAPLEVGLRGDGLQLGLRRGGPRGVVHVSRGSGFDHDAEVEVAGTAGRLRARIRLADLLPRVILLHAADAAGLEGPLRIEVR